MNEIIHDPSEYMRGIYSILINNKKRIGFLFGAGTSLAKKDAHSPSVPAIIELTAIIEKELLAIKDDKGNFIYKNIIDSLKEHLKSSRYNIEEILSILEQKHVLIGKDLWDGLNKKGFEDLILRIKKIINEKMSVHKSAINYESLIQSDFAKWIGKADRAFGIEIFTTNYEYLFELGLEHNDIPYYDGFSGSYKPFFNSDSVEKFDYLPYQTKLWKVHGSIGWHVDKETEKIIRDNSDGDDIFIFPSIFKYKDSAKQPYISLLDRLSNFLKENDSVLFTCGYAFNDEHINGRILSALNTNKSSHVIALYFDECKSEATGIIHYSLNSKSHIYKLASANSKISVLAFRSAIIGRQLGKWRLRKEPDKEDTPNVNLYFDEDAPADKSEVLKKEFKGSEKWTGEGKFLLPDFKMFVGFLNSMIVENSLTDSIKNGTK
jgi:hypothetical protein